MNKSSACSIVPSWLNQPAARRSVVALLALGTAISAWSRTQISVGQHGMQTLRIAQTRTTVREGDTLPSRDLGLETASDAKAHVKFHNGMSWQVGERADLTLDYFEYAGPELNLAPVTILQDLAVDKIRAIHLPRERARSALRGTLRSGGFTITAPRLQSASLYEIVTPEAVIDLKVVSAILNRSKTLGTRLQVFGGHALMQLPGGAVVPVRAGDQVSVSLDGHVVRGRVSDGHHASYLIAPEMIDALLAHNTSHDPFESPITDPALLEAAAVSNTL